ncbi:MFS transporter [Anaerobacillus sp. CMMVII]|uniref:MFS transporter n=1 Tax=Anaerobacillus sp. CMMVII TaxID=2755588 RepID=UPI0021B79C60|nr:MFS transporter [Anaerobacillus sp. CMMVII]MCT8139286.1 MFS transporter [Anaerobacillus sp. CMMVII]
MSSLRHDSRLYKLILANTLSSMGSGITMIAIPWLFITKDGGDVLLGYITLFSTFCLFVITPYVGVLIDQFSRKNILIYGELVGFVVIVSFVIIGFLGFDYKTWHLSVIYISGAFYYNLFYPTIFAFTQEIFERTQYKSLNGIMEVQGQIASVVAGGMAALLLPVLEIKWILLIDACTYIIALSLFLTIPYRKRFKKEQQRESFWLKLTEGFRYMKQYPRLFLFLFASFMPFLVIMVTNYTFPIYIEAVLEADASVFGMKSMVYGIGAALAGLVLPIWLTRFGNEQVIIWTMLLFTLAIAMFIFFPYIIVFYVLTLLIAIGAAGTRVARNSLMMEVIPNDKIGRVDSLFRVVGLSIRLCLLVAFTQMVANQGVVNSFHVLSVMMVASFVIIILTYKALAKRRPNLQPAKAM